MTIDSSLSVGIIGGTGKTGSQFAELFKKQGFSVETAGSKDDTSALWSNCDIVIFAVPLRQSVEIIEKEIAEATRANQLILDLSSLKSKQVEAMLPAAGEVIGMHPLFGPSTDAAGESIMLCPGRAQQETIDSLQHVLEAMGLRVLIKTPQEHDHLMALIQVVPHLKSFLVAGLLKDLDADIKEILETCTPAYELELNVVGRFLDDSPDLYGPIIFENPEAKNVLRKLRGAIDRAIEMEDTADLDRFAEQYTELQEFFGPLMQTAREHSEACIRILAKLKK